MSQCVAWKPGRGDVILYCILDAGHVMPHRDSTGSERGEWHLEPRRYDAPRSVLPEQPKEKS